MPYGGLTYKGEWVSVPWTSLSAAQVVVALPTGPPRPYPACRSKVRW